MLPNISILGRDIPTYGLLAGVGILLAVLYFKLEEKRRNNQGGDTSGAALRISLKESADREMTFLFGLIGVFIGAKLLSLLTQLPGLIRDWPLLFSNPEAFLSTYLFSGFVFYGGLYGGLLGAWAYTKVAKVPFSTMLPSLMPVVPLIHAFGRLGCFCTGCCYGIPHETLGMYFSASAIAPGDVPLLPVQVYEAVLEAGLFVLLHLLSRKGEKKKSSDTGWLMLGLYLCIYGVARFLLEFLRGDAYRGFIGPLSVSQIISIPTVAWGVWLLWREKRVPAKSETLN